MGSMEAEVNARGQRTDINLHVRDGLGGITALARSHDAGATLRIPCAVHTDVSDGDLHLSTSVVGIATLHLDAEDVRQLLAALAPVPAEAPEWSIEDPVEAVRRVG